MAYVDESPNSLTINDNVSLYVDFAESGVGGVLPPAPNRNPRSGLPNSEKVWKHSRAFFRST